MRINSELIKTAIADAKAIRVTAYANAKASLEEAFAPRFEAMFADKLKEDAEEEQEEVTMSEVEAPNQVSGKGGEAKGPKTKAVTKGQPKKVSDGNTNFKTVAVGGSEGAAGSKAPRASVGISESAEEEEEGKSVDENYEEEESVSEAGLTSEDLDEVIRELEAEVAEEEEGKHVEEPVSDEFPPAEQTPEDGSEPHEPHDSESHDDEIPGEEPHDEVPDDEHNEDPSSETDGENPFAGHDKDGNGEAEGDGEVNIDVNPAPPVEAPFGAHKGVDDEEVNLEELLAALNEESEEEEDDEEGKAMDEAADNGLPKSDLKGQDKSGGVKGYPKAPQDASKKQLKGKNHNIGGKGNLGKGSPSGLSEVTKYEKALKEAYDTIEFLRGQINEVNLLNAKLLYTNRLFKDFASVIDDNHRMNIVEKFDLTKSVREVKMAYVILAEALSFSTARKQIVTSKPAPRADTSSKRSVAKQITEGLASKPVASTKPSREIISEGVDEMAKRFQKLAGIKKPVDPKK